MRGLESPIARNFSVNYPASRPLPRLVHKQFDRGLNPRGHHQQHRQHRHPARFASSIRHASFLFNSLMQRCSCLACSIMGSLHLGLASFPCCAGAPTSHLQLRFCTALSFPALPKVHSDAAGGPLSLLQSRVVMLAMLNFLILFVRTTFASSSPPTDTPSIRRTARSPYLHAPASDPLAHVDEKAALLRCDLCVFIPGSLPS